MRCSDFITIPPGEEAYQLDGYCTKESTSQMIPEAGTNVFAILLHSHLAGTGINLQHKNKEGVTLPSPAFDVHYDFNLQDVNPIHPVRKVYPGDEFKLSCTYNTMDRNYMTFGGLGTYDEMCLAYMYHYPRTELSACLSGRVSNGVHFAGALSSKGNNVFSEQFAIPKFDNFQDHLNCDCGECVEGGGGDDNLLNGGAARGVRRAVGVMIGASLVALAIA